MGWKQTFQKKMKAAGMENDIPAASRTNRNADSGGWQDKFRSKMEAAGMGGDIIRTGGRTAADVAPSTYKPDTSMLVTPSVPAGNTTSAAGKYNVGQGLAKAGQMGLTQIAKVGSSAGAWIENLLGDFAREGSNGYWDPDTSNWLFNRWNRAIDAEAQGVQQRYAENTARGGKAAQVFEDLGAATVAAVPQAIAALFTGGASAAAQAGALAENAAASSGLVSTISRSMRAMAKDPNFQLSFAQVFGPGYEQAKADGADDFRASVYAIGNGLMNAAVEVGGGIQTLPRELQNGGNAWKTWVDAMLDEGKEEVVQGVIERATQNAVYGRDNPLVGIGNGAIFDPAAAAEEFAGGAVVGGILGGGQVGVNTLANRAAYNAARAQYDRDVRQNTAPEMDGRTAEAVEAVTRGETITGNQAAAIARDPVAVETLEASTGVKLDTEKPISQLKREIIALASRETAQEQTQRTTAIPQTQKRAQKAVGGFMEAGQRAYQQVREASGSGAEVYAGFSAMYNAGLNGVEADKAKGKYAAKLTPEQRYTAYNAGLEDARAQVARENADAAYVTTTAGAGLADNAYSRYIIAKDKGAASTLNTIGKKLGVRIEFVDSIMDGQANGQYIREKNLIQIAADSTNPIYEVAGHEVTHRMQDLSPNEYRAFRQAAIEYRMRENGADTETEVVQRYMEAAERAGVTLTQDEVMDEIAADFAGRMIEDTDLFAQFAKDNRTAAQKLLDGLKEFLAKVKAMFTGKARDNAAMDAYGKTFGELEDIAQKWQAAFDAAERQAEKTKTAAGDGDGRMMLKNYSYDALVRKPDMTLAVVEDADGLTRKEVIDKALEEAKKYGGVNQNGNVYVHVNDTDADVVISAKALRHGLDRRFTVNAPATLKVGEILQNAVRVNELVPKLDTVDATYVLMGAAKNKNNEPYIVQFVVNRASNEVMSVDVLYAINAKTEPAGSLSPEITGVPATLTGSSISIADLLTYVNRYFPDVLPESVLRHFGHSERPAGKLGEGALFSLKAPVEETKNLLALHNLTEKNLLDAAKLGGLPMPSIAIVKADEGHGEYGDISFVFSKDTIDPQLFRSNKVYGYDAWTPTAPRIEYEVNEKSAKKIHDLFYRMERAKGRSFADPLYSVANTLEDELNRKGGVDKVVGAMRDDPRVMNIYLEDTGRGAAENVMKREVTRMDDNQQEMASFLIRELGESTVNDFRAKGGESPIAARKLWYKEHGEALNAALQKHYEKLGLPSKDAADVVNAETFAAKMRYMLDARKYLAGNTETVTEEVDRDATNEAIRDKVNQKEYEQWLDNLFDGVVKNEGIYNGKDYYTSSGNRRSFSATHYEITLENIVKAMKQGDQKGANTFFGGQAIWGVASKDYGSIDEIKADSGRLQKMTEEEYSAIR